MNVLRKEVAELNQMMSTFIQNVTELCTLLGQELNDQGGTGQL